MSTQHVDNAAVLDGVIAVTTAGPVTTPLVSAPTNKAVRLLSYVLTVPAGATIIWKSGSTAKSGPMVLTSGVAVGSPGPGGKQFQCALNQALNLTTDLAGNYGGHFSYQIVES